MTVHIPGDMYARCFPGEPYVTEYIPTNEEVAAVTAAAERRDAGDLLPMVLGLAVAS